MKQKIQKYCIISIIHLERRTVLGACLAVIVDAGGGNVGVAKPFLNLGDVGLVVEGIGGGGRAQRMGADLEAELCRICLYQLVDRVGRERLLEGLGLAAVVFNRSEQRAVVVFAVAGGVEVIVDERVGPGMQRQKPHFLALAADFEMRN